MNKYSCGYENLIESILSNEVREDATLTVIRLLQVDLLSCKPNSLDLFLVTTENRKCINTYRVFKA